VLGASPASAAKVSPKQAAGKCKAALKANPLNFTARYGTKKKVALTRCVATKLSLPDIISHLPALGSGQLPDLSQLPPLPPQACAALNSALAQAGQFNFAQLLNIQLPSLPSLPGLPVQVQQQLVQLQTLLSQVQTMLVGQLGFLQTFLQSQLSGLLAQAQAQLAIVCPTG
jgi:hypothetical protein